MENNILDEQNLENSITRRRDLLPTWIKVFIWIFFLLSISVPFAIFCGITGRIINLSLYGLETYFPFSLIGIIIISLFLFKGIVAFGLWTEKYWAVNLAIVDAVIGMIICFVSMFILPFLFDNGGMNFNIRLELVALIPYFRTMMKIKPKWLASA